MKYLTYENKKILDQIGESEIIEYLEEIGFSVQMV